MTQPNHTSGQWRRCVPLILAGLWLVACDGVLSGAIVLGQTDGHTPFVGDANSVPDAGLSGSDAFPLAEVGPGGDAAAQLPHDASSGTSSAPGMRDVYQWPFPWDAPWNLPLSKEAKLSDWRFDDHPETKNIFMLADVEYINLDPSFPTFTPPGFGGQVHYDPALVDGQAPPGDYKNRCATFLVKGSQTKVWQRQSFFFYGDGSPPSLVHQGWMVDGVDLKSNHRVMEGCHGGAGGSGIGGTIRKGDLAGDQPIRHVLKLEPLCRLYCNPTKGAYTWPAVKADTGWDNPGGGNYYGGHAYNTPTALQMGALLALKADDPDVVSLLKTLAAKRQAGDAVAGHAHKIAVALATYGGYVIDTAGWPQSNPFYTSIEKDAAPGVHQGQGMQAPFSDYLKQVYSLLRVVTNNSQQTPGGGAIGSPRRACYAPPFKDDPGSAPPPTPAGSDCH